MVNMQNHFDWLPFACPCCRSKTLSEKGGYEICSVCGWEDDPVQSKDPAYSGGANKDSLSLARMKWMNKQQARILGKSRWISETNLEPFLTTVSWIVKYKFDDRDWEVMSKGVLQTDAEADKWYSYEFSGEQTAKMRIARDVGSSVIWVDVDLAEEHQRTYSIITDIFSVFLLETSAKRKNPYE
jgi:Cysteine-rich CPCC